jgi:hypothetical protein
MLKLEKTLQKKTGGNAQDARGPGGDHPRGDAPAAVADPLGPLAAVAAPHKVGALEQEDGP